MSDNIMERARDLASQMADLSSKQGYCITCEQSAQMIAEFTRAEARLAASRAVKLCDEKLNDWTGQNGLNGETANRIVAAALGEEIVGT